MNQPITPRKVYTEADYEPFVTGKQPLPNPVDVELANAVDSIAAGGHMMKPVWGYSLGKDGHKRWTQFFLYGSSNMGGLDGQGYALIYGGYGKGGTIVQFAICRHEKIEGAGANHSRGWHPGHCAKCGMDMTIDSGD